MPRSEINRFGFSSDVVGSETGRTIVRLFIGPSRIPCFEFESEGFLTKDVAVQMAVEEFSAKLSALLSA